MCGCFSMPPTGDLACNPGMCPDWESNQQSFGSQAHAQSTELHQPGSLNDFSKFILVITNQLGINSNIWTIKNTLKVKTASVEHHEFLEKNYS